MLGAGSVDLPPTRTSLSPAQIDFSLLAGLTCSANTDLGLIIAEGRLDVGQCSSMEALI